MMPTPLDRVPVSDFIYVPVPSVHVIAVMRHIADLELVDSTDAPAEFTTELAWPDAELARFAHSDSKTLRIISDVCDVLAERPNEWMNLDQLASLTTWERPTLRSVWTHGTRVLKAHFDGKPLPLESEWGTQLHPPLEPVQYYCLTDEQAKQWKKVRGSVR